MLETPSHPDTSAPQSDSARGVSPALGCGMLLVVFVIGIVCIWMVGALAFQGEILFRAGQPDEIRVWLVHDQGLAGLGLSYARQADQVAGDSRRCFQHQVRFLLWRDADQGQAAEFCRCYQAENGEWIDVGTCADF